MTHLQEKSKTITGITFFWSKLVTEKRIENVFYNLLNVKSSKPILGNYIVHKITISRQIADAPNSKEIYQKS